jgi:hypothetical protein
MEKVILTALLALACWGAVPAPLLDTMRVQRTFTFNNVTSDSTYLNLKFWFADPDSTSMAVDSSDWVSPGQTFSAGCNSFSAWITPSYEDGRIPASMDGDSIVLYENEAIDFDEIYTVNLDSLKGTVGHSSWRPWGLVRVHIHAFECGWDGTLRLDSLAEGGPYILEPFTVKRTLGVGSSILIESTP